MLTTYLALPQHEGCSGYAWLNDSNRNKEYTAYTGYCDNGLRGWHRFGGGAGIKMATSCVDVRRCGTAQTGWMSGALPIVADGEVTRKVCYHWSGKCCRSFNNIQVVNCGQYYVYKLSGTPTCNMRYCGSDN